MSRDLLLIGILPYWQKLVSAYLPLVGSFSVHKTSLALLCSVVIAVASTVSLGSVLQAHPVVPHMQAYKATNASCFFFVTATDDLGRFGPRWLLGLSACCVHAYGQLSLAQAA